MVFFLMLLGALVAGCESVAFHRVAEPAGEVLAVHETRARFEGLAEMPCQHLTAQCPDACNHGGRYAQFAIVAYTGYEKRGVYGDEQQTRFAFRVALKDGSADGAVPEALRQVVEKLRPGQEVALTWWHVYVTDPATGSKWPERVVMNLAE